ncbi:MAG: hypothetical protein U0800_08775 [Isosphaeraceae bacterium]
MRTTESDRPIGGKSPKPWVSEALAVLTSRTFVFLAGWAASFLIVFIRNPDAYLNPVFLTEDGRDYVAGIYRVGFWQALFGARGDYLVFGNVFLTWLGVRAFDLLGHGRFADLPRYLALISYAYFAVVIALPLYVFRGRLRLPYLAALWLLTAFVPLGISDNEILGRLSNIGFACAYAGLLLAWFRTCGEGPRLIFALADLGMLACAATNPIVLALMPIVAGVAVFRLLRRDAVASPVTLVALAFGCVLIVRYAVRPWWSRKRAPLDFSQTVEVGVALRDILFPFVYPFYSRSGIRVVVPAGLARSHRGGRRPDVKNLGVYAMGGYFLAITSLVLVINGPNSPPTSVAIGRPADPLLLRALDRRYALLVFAAADLASRTQLPSPGATATSPLPAVFRFRDTT